MHGAAAARRGAAEAASRYLCAAHAQAQTHAPARKRKR
jgi:hypothetical protein